MSLKLNSGLRVLKIVNILMSRPASRESICFELDKINLGIFKNTLSKYITVLRKIGFEIVKKNNKFDIITTPFKIRLEEDEKEGFRILNSIFEQFYTKAKEDEYKNKIRKRLLNMIENDGTNILNKKGMKKLKFAREKETAEKIGILEGYISEIEVEIKLLYDGKEIFVIPKEILYRKNGIFLHAYDVDKNKYSLLKIKQISKIEISSFFPRRRTSFPDHTTFVIKGRLRKNYILKDGEKAYYIHGKMLITNETEDKSRLFDRLLKYGKYCEVLYPACERENFAKKVEDLIEYYQTVN